MLNKSLEFFDYFVESSEGLGRLRKLILESATNGSLATHRPEENKPTFKQSAHMEPLPSNWIWCELQDIASYGGGGSIVANNIPKDAWLLDLEDIEKTSSKLLKRVYGENRKSTSNKAIFQTGDVLYGKLRPYLDKVLIADQAGFCTTEIVPIRPKSGIEPAWLRLCLKRPAFLQFVASKSYGMKMPRLGTKDANRSIHPVPPIEEQRRIVASVNTLFDFCDQLESKLITRNELRENFLNSFASS